KRIDFYVQHLIRHNADEIVLRSGQPVLFRLPVGERASNAAIDHAQVTQLVQESAPPNVIDELRRTAQSSFEHESNGVKVRIDVRTIAPREWEVTIKPSKAIGGARPAAVSAVRPAPVGVVGSDA